MAEFLVIAEDGNGSGRPQKGDLVQAASDGTQWGGKECLPRFLVVCVSGMSVADASELCTPLYGPDHDIIEWRRYNIDISDIDLQYIASQQWAVPTLSRGLISDKAGS